MMQFRLSLNGFDPDAAHDPAVAFNINVGAEDQQFAEHQHRKGQLIVALHGGVTCEVKQAM